MSELAAVLFDNDGVLVDTEHLFFEACRAMLADCGIELTEALFAEYSLTRGVTPLEIAVERGVVHRQEFPTRLAARDDYYSELLSKQDNLLEGAAETVRAVSERLRVGVVTSAKRRHFELTHRHSGLLDVFEFSYAREDYVRSKPHPDPYQRALDDQGLRPEQCVVVEDTPRGLRAALAAGLECYVVPNPLARGGDFRGAKQVLQNIAELARVLA